MRVLKTFFSGFIQVLHLILIFQTALLLPSWTMQEAHGQAAQAVAATTGPAEGEAAAVAQVLVVVPAGGLKALDEAAGTYVDKLKDYADVIKADVTSVQESPLSFEKYDEKVNALFKVLEERSSIRCVDGKKQVIETTENDVPQDKNLNSVVVREPRYTSSTAGSDCKSFTAEQAQKYNNTLYLAKKSAEKLKPALKDMTESIKILKADGVSALYENVNLIGVISSSGIKKAAEDLAKVEAKLKYAKGLSEKICDVRKNTSGLVDDNNIIGTVTESYQALARNKDGLVGAFTAVRTNLKASFDKFNELAQTSDDAKKELRLFDTTDSGPLGDYFKFFDDAKIKGVVELISQNPIKCKKSDNALAERGAKPRSAAPGQPEQPEVPEASTTAYQRDPKNASKYAKIAEKGKGCGEIPVEDPLYKDCINRRDQRENREYEERLLNGGGGGGGGGGGDNGAMMGGVLAATIPLLGAAMLKDDGDKRDPAQDELALQNQQFMQQMMLADRAAKEQKQQMMMQMMAQCGTSQGIFDPASMSCKPDPVIVQQRKDEALARFRQECLAAGGEFKNTGDPLTSECKPKVDPIAEAEFKLKLKEIEREHKRFLAEYQEKCEEAGGEFNRDLEYCKKPKHPKPHCDIQSILYMRMAQPQCPVGYVFEADPLFQYGAQLPPGLMQNPAGATTTSAVAGIPDMSNSTGMYLPGYECLANNPYVNWGRCVIAPTEGTVTNPNPPQPVVVPDNVMTSNPDLVAQNEGGGNISGASGTGNVNASSGETRSGGTMLFSTSPECARCGQPGIAPGSNDCPTRCVMSSGSSSGNSTK